MKKKEYFKMPQLDRIEYMLARQGIGSINKSIFSNLHMLSNWFFFMLSLFFGIFVVFSLLALNFPDSKYFFFDTVLNMFLALKTIFKFGVVTIILILLFDAWFTYRNIKDLNLLAKRRFKLK